MARIAIAGLSGMSCFMRCDHFHADGETVQATALHFEPGGKGFNQAVAARRLGAEVLFLSCCGQDDNGKSCCALLEREGVQALWSPSSKPTALAHILTDRYGSNRVTVFPGAAADLSAGFLLSHACELADCAILLAGLECPLPALQALVDTARPKGIPVLLNPAPSARLDRDFLRQFFLLTPNRQEAALLLGLEGSPSPQALSGEILRQGYPRVVVTLGREGALAVHQGEAWLYPAPSVAARDTTGAGDCFNAALAVALAQGQPLGDAVSFAVLASALSVRTAGVMDALPTVRQVEENRRPICPVRLI